MWVGRARPGIETQWLPRSISFARPNGSFLWKRSGQQKRRDRRLRFCRLRPRQKEQQAPVAVGGQRNAGRDGSSTGHYPRKHPRRSTNVNGLGLGEQLRIGPVLLQASAVCTPCDQLAKVRPDLRREIYGRLGMLCQVLRGGTNSRRRRDRARQRFPRKSLENFAKLLRRVGPATQRRCFRRMILVLFRVFDDFRSFHRLIRRHNPLESVLFFECCHHKMPIWIDQRHRGAQKSVGVLSDCFLRLSIGDHRHCFRNFAVRLGEFLKSRLDCLRGVAEA